MMKNNLNMRLIVCIGLIAIVSGCVGGQDINSVVKALPEVQQFMNEHPNAKITVTYWSKEEVAKSAQEISQQCDKTITPIALYKAVVSEGDLKVISWVNAENQIVICSTTQGRVVPTASITASNYPNTPTTVIPATPAATEIPLQQVTSVPTTIIPATPTATEIPAPQVTPVPTTNELTPGTLYVTARMLTPAYWSNNNYELRAFKVEIYNQGTASLNIKAQVNNDGQTLEERSFSLNGGGSSYQFVNDRNHFINSTNVTLRLTVNSYQPVDYPFESVGSLA